MLNGFSGYDHAAVNVFLQQNGADWCLNYVLTTRVTYAAMLPSFDRFLFVLQILPLHIL